MNYTFVISDNAFFYFFSTYSQSLAGLVGLSSAFAIFRYQNLRVYYTEKVEKIYSVFSKSYRILLTDKEYEKFKSFVNHEQRAAFVYPIYFNWIKEDKNDELKIKFQDDEGKIREFRSWVDEFSDYRSVKKQMSSFRS